MTCPQSTPAPLRCPSIDETRDALFALLPHGRAWQTHDGGPRQGSVLYGYFAAAAEVLHYIASRYCDLREEFFCKTANETRPEWMLEYGLPDACDPYPNLCVKVAALGDGRCDYFVSIANNAGWSITCEPVSGICGTSLGTQSCGFSLGSGYLGNGGGPGNARPMFYGFQLGCATLGCSGLGALGRRRVIPQLKITVDLAASEAYAGGWAAVPRLGCFQIGNPLGCDPDISALKCLIDRIVPGHIKVIYDFVPPITFLMVDDETHLADEAGALFTTE